MPGTAPVLQEHAPFGGSGHARRASSGASRIGRRNSSWPHPRERGGICCWYSLGAPHAAPADAARLCDSPGSRALPQSRARARSSNRAQHCVCYRKKFPVLKFHCARFEVWLDILRCAKASEPAGEDAPEATEDVGPQSNAAVEPSSARTQPKAPRNPLSPDVAQAGPGARDPG